MSLEQKTSAEIAAIREGLQNIIQRLDEIGKAYQQLPVSARTSFELSSQQLSQLPWKPYRQGHRSAWIFADIHEAKRLYDIIKESETGKVHIDEFEYKITAGESKEFISRNPIK